MPGDDKSAAGRDSRLALDNAGNFQICLFEIPAKLNIDTVRKKADY
jgi:hypothetical protein